MAKKRTKTATKKKTTTRRAPSNSNSSQKLETRILNNLIELQKVHTNLAEKFDNLTEQISGLLALFEMSARAFAKNPALEVAEKDKEFLNKIDKLLEQNKTIAKGLTLMESKMREKVYGLPQPHPMQRPPSSPQNRPLPRF